MTESKELVEIKKETVIEAYTTGVGLQSVVDGVQKLVDEFDYDLSTQAGIKKAKSFAAAIPRVKTTLDNIGKDLVSDWKGKAKVVDAKRKEMRDSLDALRDEAKKPIEAHEQEQVRIALEKAAVLKAQEDAKQKESDWEFALLMDEKFDRDLAEAEANAKAERERIAAEEIERQRKRDEQIRLDAEEKAKQESAQALKEAEEEKQRLENEAIAAKEREIAAEALRVEMEEKAKQDAIKAEEHAKWLKQQALVDAEVARHKAEEDAKAAAEAAEAQRAALEAARAAAVEKAKQDAIEAKAEAARNKIKAEEHAKWLKQQALVDAEVARFKAEEDAKAAAEAARLAEIERQRMADEKAAEDLRKLEANKKHVGAVRKLVKESLMEICKLSEADAKAVVLALSKGQIKRSSIDYSGDVL